MNVFVTGGSGVLGRGAIQRLVAAGHDVTALAHRDATRDSVEKLGARACSGTLWEPATYRDAIQAVDAVLHLATRIPPPAKAGRRSAWTENDRIRRDGTRRLLETMRPSATFVYPSVCLVYPDSGEAWIDAATAAPADVSPILRSTLEAEDHVARFAKSGGRGIVLRMAQFYGDDLFSRQALRLARSGFAASPGSANAYQSWIWIDDAAASVVAALIPRVSAGIYDVTDDEPLRRANAASALAAAVGRRRLWQIPNWLVRLIMGPVYAALARSQRVSSRRFKQASGWQPEVKSVRDGWRVLASRLA